MCQQRDRFDIIKDILEIVYDRASLSQSDESDKDWFRGWSDSSANCYVPEDARRSRIA
ncbi:MAG TPA: hypothetical protein VE544_13605 [Nitrososphaeraceae archaeon]|nr:hypothetical protein [Nitrososphaeraceae archaeon]